MLHFLEERLAMPPSMIGCYARLPPSTPEGLRRDLEERGVAVVPGVVARARCEELRAEAAAEILGFTRGAVDIRDGKTFRGWSEYGLLHSMLLQHSGVGNMRWLWSVRQEPAVVGAFAALWGVAPGDLLVSFDGMSLHLPPESTSAQGHLQRGWYKGNDWMHTDQGHGKPGFESVQGLVNVYDVHEGDATLCVWEGSHRLHGEFFAMKGAMGRPATSSEDWYKVDGRSEEEREFFASRGCRKLCVLADAGDLVLWDSRTFHQGLQPSRGRAQPNTRLVAYVCYTPRCRASAQDLRRKERYFLEGRTTTHCPHRPKAFPKRPRVYPGQVLPEVSPVPPMRAELLSGLGRRLAGLGGPVLGKRERGEERPGVIVID